MSKRKSSSVSYQPHKRVRPEEDEEEEVEEDHEDKNHSDESDELLSTQVRTFENMSTNSINKLVSSVNGNRAHYNSSRSTSVAMLFDYRCYEKLMQEMTLKIQSRKRAGVTARV